MISFMKKQRSVSLCLFHKDMHYDFHSYDPVQSAYNNGLSVPLNMCFYIHLSNWQFQHFQKDLLQINTICCHWWEVNIISANGLLPLGSNEIRRRKRDSPRFTATTVCTFISNKQHYTVNICSEGYMGIHSSIYHLNEFESFILIRLARSKRMSPY